MSDKYKHNYKLSIDNKKEILLSYQLDKSSANVQALANEYNISRGWIYQLVKSEQGKQLLEQTIDENKSNLTKKIDIIIDKALIKINEKLDNGDIDKVSFKDLAVLTGTLYDKSRLENNLSTSNNSININIKVEK